MRSQFQRTGLVRRPGAIPAAEAAAIVDRIWEHLDRRLGVARDRPDTWTVDQPAGLRAITDKPEFEALGSPAVRAALDDLLGAGRWPAPRRWGRPLVTFPARDKRSALAQLGAGVQRATDGFVQRGSFPAGLSVEEQLRRFHAFYGHPDEIIAGLRAERVLPVATDLIAQFNPGIPDRDAAIRALELIATEVAPALGWQPRTARLAVA